jgi:hypothetical protein
MRAGGGKSKGAQFERDACVMLSKWVTNDTQHDIFWRSAMSGGRATVAHKRKGQKLSSQAGDVSCVHPAGAAFISSFVVECKFYADLNFDGLLTGKGKLVEFWNKLKAEARAHDKSPFLVCKQNRLPAFIGLSLIGAESLGLSSSFFQMASPTRDLWLIAATSFVTVCKPCSSL